MFRTGVHLTRVDCCTGNPFAPGGGTGSNAVSAPPLPASAPSWGTGQDAAAPPPSASVNEFETSPSGGQFVQPQPFASSNTSSPGGQSGAVPGGALEDENDSCVICMAAPVQAGFLHGSRWALNMFCMVIATLHVSALYCKSTVCVCVSRFVNACMSHRHKQLLQFDACNAAPSSICKCTWHTVYSLTGSGL